ncbi:MAG: hypothetical protein M3348_18305 [Acidobacteriota bacterium]|nr:hypothetical protein [Acidobacteriota bacterium]
MDDKIIKRIELDIEGVGINLTPEQARKLHAALAELLGVKPEKEVVRVIERTYPYWPWYQPSITISAGHNDKFGFSGTGNVTANYVAESGTAKVTLH